ncbi:MAG TPA: LPXTG cell wall anchor domain-containing protein [Pseudonocardiaceae bacterium]|jgi:LPXTG-motif cell wall-anchored protein
MSLGRPLRTTAVLLAVATAVFGGAQAGSAAAADEHAAPAAARWLADQLVDGNHLETAFGGQTYPDQGLTADAVLAFDAADTAQDAAKAATAWLSGPDVLPFYVGDGDLESYPGALAKLALVAIAQGEDPAAFGGVNLIERLAARLDPATGRFSDKSQYGDFTNGITQSLAIIALLRAGTPAADLTAPVDFLVASECPDGGFPLEFGKQPCASDVDTTGFVIQALLAADRDTAAEAALDHLEAVQDGGGGFGGSGPTSAVNANSTGLAAQALRVGGRTEAADAAVQYLLDRQVGCEGPTEQRGAISYDASGFEQSTAVRATAQALYGLTGTGLSTIDNSGDAATAPALDCAPPTSSTSPTTTTAVTTTATTTATATTPTATAQPSTRAVAAGTGELPATGARTRPATALGVLLLLAGGAALLLSRRRRTAAGERP